MKEILKDFLDKKCKDWNTWIDSYENFISSKDHDSVEKMYQYRHLPSYCIWKEEKNYIITISYKYVHALTIDGQMYCLQKSSPTKIKLLKNYKKLDSKNYLPSLDIIEISEDYIYTMFSSPNNELGYPSPYVIFNRLLNSQDPIKGFENYIKKIIDTYIDLCFNCKKNNVPFYSIQRILTSNFYNEEIFYLKDSVFYLESNNYRSADELINSLVGIIDGFRRAEGVINIYKLRQDSTREGVEQMFSTIEFLKDYARKKCQNLKNVDLL